MDALGSVVGHFKSVSQARVSDTECSVHELSEVSPDIVTRSVQVIHILWKVWHAWKLLKVVFSLLITSVRHFIFNC